VESLQAQFGQISGSQLLVAVLTRAAVHVALRVCVRKTRALPRGLT
jgi:hypothetical protein